MKEFVNRSGNDLNKRLLEVENVIRGEDGEIKTLEVKVSRLDTETTVEGTPLDADVFNEIVRSMVREIPLTNAQKNIMSDADELVVASEVSGNVITLATSGNRGSVITWASSDESIISSTGVVNGVDSDKVVTLTATISLSEYVVTKEFEVKVLAFSEQRAVEEVKEKLISELKLQDANISEDFYVPKEELYGTEIRWSSSDTNTVSIVDNGTNYKVLINKTNEAKQVSLTMTVALNETTSDYVFVFTVARLTDEEIVSSDKETLVVNMEEDADEFELDLKGKKGSNITWASSDENIISISNEVATIYRTLSDQNVSLTATLQSGEVEDTKNFDLVVKARELTTQEKINACISDVTNKMPQNVKNNFQLPEATYGVGITWTLENEENITIIGSNVTINRGVEDVTVKINAEFELEGVINTKEYSIVIEGTKEEDEEKAIRDLENLNLPTEVAIDFELAQRGDNGSEITWTSSNENAIKIENYLAKVYRSLVDQTVILTAKAKYNESEATESFNVIVTAREMTDEEKVNEDMDNLSLDKETSKDLDLTTTGANGTTIVWSSSNEEVIRIDGSKGIVTRMLQDVDVELTATGTIEGTQILVTKYFNVLVQKRELTDSERVQLDKAALSVVSSATSNFYLETTGSNGSTITWSKGGSGISLSDNYVTVTRQLYTQTGYLYATISYGEASDTKTFTVTIPERSLTDSERVELDIDGLYVPSSVTEDFNLDTTGSNGSTIIWSSSNTSRIEISGSNAYVTRGSTDETVTLTATVSYGNIRETKNFDVVVEADETQTPDMGGDDGNESEESTVTYSISNQYLMWYGTNTSGTIEIEFTNGSGYVEVSLDDSYFNVSISGNYSSSVDIDISEKTQPDLTMTSIFDVYISVYDSDDILLGTEVGQISYE